VSAVCALLHGRMACTLGGRTHRYAPTYLLWPSQLLAYGWRKGWHRI